MASPLHISQLQKQTRNEPKSDGFLRSFVSHPASVGESYLGHFFFALRFSVRLFLASCAAMVHAFIPAWFETTASAQVEKMHAALVARHSEQHRD